MQWLTKVVQGNYISTDPLNAQIRPVQSFPDKCLKMLKLILPKDHIELSLCGLKKTLEHHFSIISYKSIVLLIYAFRRKKNLEEVLHLQPRPHVYFTSLTLICQLPFIPQVLVETTCRCLISQMLAFLGTLFILTIKISLPWTKIF